MKIAIIGGGITGLAAAHRLHELLPRAELSLFESSPRLGGVIDTIQIDGFLIERSADNFLTRQNSAIELCRRLGIADDLLPTDETRRRAFVVRNGRLFPIPAGFYLMSPRKLWPLLTSPILSLPGKLRALAEPWISRRSSQSDADDESIASFARRRLGREAFERLVQPLVAGIYTADPEKLSMAATMPEFFAVELEHGSLLRAARAAKSAGDGSDVATGARYSQFVAPRNGMQSLIDALASRLPANAIYLGTRVTRIEASDNSGHKLTFDQATPVTPHSALRTPHSDFAAAILATPAYDAAHLLKPLDPALADELAAIEYSSCAVVSLGFKRSQIRHPLDGFGFVVPHVEDRPIIAGSFASLKYLGRAPADDVLIRAFLGGALRPELLNHSDDDLRRIALDELRVLLGIQGEPRVADVTRSPNSMPQYHVGHLTRVGRIEALAAQHPTLALAGNAYHGVGIPQCIASAEAAAERIASLLS